MTWEWARRERAGLTKPSRSGEPSNWTKWPKEMNLSRCIARALRQEFRDFIGGRYIPEEMSEELPEDQIGSARETCAALGPSHALELKVIGSRDPELREYQALKQGEVGWRDLMDEKRDGEKGEETSKLQKALAAQEAKKASLRRLPLPPPARVGRRPASPADERSAGRGALERVSG